jgi:hypothetical protein
MSEPLSEAPPRVGAPVTLRIAVQLLRVEAVGFLVLEGFWIRELLTQQAARPQWAVTVAVLLPLFAVLCGVLATFLSRRRGGARNPAVVLHLLAMPVGYYMITGGVPAFGALAIAVCVGGIGVLVAPPTTRALGLH